MAKSNPTRRRNPSEDGYMLVAVIFMLAIFMLTMTIAAPQIKKEIQRDRDIETMHRGKQYIRAIRLYYRKFNAYPPSIDALVKTNEIRFLRKKYVDPTTGKAEWKPIAMGQNKCPIVYGFFGQPIGGASIAGTGPSGGNGVNGASSLIPGTNGTNGGQSGSGNPPVDPNNPGNNGTNPNNPQSGQNGSNLGSTNGFSGQTFGGAGIIGFSPVSPKQSIYVYKKKNHYNEWEFTYDPMMERMQLLGGSSSGPPGSTPASGISSGIGGSSSGGTPNPVSTPAPSTIPPPASQ
jgi:type II secretory pathway pseudopilin PulG